MSGQVRVSLPSGPRIAVSPGTPSSEVVSLLRDSGAPLSAWLDVSRQAVASGQPVLCRALLEACTDPPPPGSPPPQQQQALCALAWLHLSSARACRDAAGDATLSTQRASAIAAASSLLLRARQLDVSDALPALGLAALSLERDGSPQAARTQLRLAARQRCGGRPSLAPALALAALELHSGDAQEALRLLKPCLARWPRAPAEIRAALGDCHALLGRPARAKQAYERALELRPDCAPALLGLASLSLSAASSAHKDALAAAAELRSAAAGPSPSEPAAQRRARLASVAARRQARDHAARAGLGLLRSALAAGGFVEAGEGGGGCLAAPGSARALVMLAHESLRSGRPDAAAAAARAAAAAAGSPALRSRAACLLARALHARGAAAEASQAYSAALGKGGTAPQGGGGLQGARVGAAQLLLLRGDAGGSAHTLARALEAAGPDAADDALGAQGLALLARLLPSLAARGAEPAGVRARLADALRATLSAARPASDAAEARARELQELLGDVLAPERPAEACAAYDAALVGEIGEDGEEGGGGASNASGAPKASAAASLRLLNNAAVAHARVGDPSRAQRLLAAALRRADAGGLGDLGAGAAVTVGFNVARVREALGDASGAAREYGALLAQFPRYGDCLLRLAALARARGDGGEELLRAQELRAAGGRDADAEALAAAVHLDRRDYARARRAVDLLLRAAARDAPRQLEAHGRLLAAELELRQAPRPTKDPSGARQALGRALGGFRAVLQAQPDNVFAAAGVACVLAQGGHVAAAKHVLGLVLAAGGEAGPGRLAAGPQAASALLPHAAANLAHCELALGDARAAAHLYASAARRAKGGARAAALLLQRARALHDAGDARAARGALAAALRLAPGDEALWFDLAYLRQEAGVAGLARAARGELGSGAGAASRAASGAARVRACVAELASARRLFEHLKARAARGASKLSGSKLQAHVSFLAQAEKNAEGLVRRAEEEDALEEARAEQRRAQAAAAAAARRAEAEEARAAREAAARAREEAARGNARRLERLREEWRASEAAARAAAKGDASGVPRPSEAGGGQALEDAPGADYDSAEDEDFDPGAAEKEDALRGAGLLSSSEGEVELGPGDEDAGVGKKKRRDGGAVRAAKKKRREDGAAGAGAKERLERALAKRKEREAGAPKGGRLEKKRRERKKDPWDSDLEDADLGGADDGGNSHAAALLDDDDEE